MSKKFYTQITDGFVRDVKEKIKGASRIIITSHKAPDDDSVASSLGMYTYLVDYQKIPRDSVRILYTGERIDRWDYFKYWDKVEFVDDIANHLAGCDLLILLDGSGWMRFSRDEKIREFCGFTVCIDHHPTPEDRFDLHLVESNYSSAAEIVYKLFFENEELTKELSEILMMGILGDTGNFRYVEPKKVPVFDVAKRLVVEGNIKIESLLSKYSNIPYREYLVLAKLMSNSKLMNINGWPEFIVSWLSRDYMNENKFTDNEMAEGNGLFCQYLKGLKGINWGFAVTPRLDGSCSISLRSIPNSVSVRVMMEETKFGGGHDRAAGGKIPREEPKSAVAQMLSWMKKNKPVIN